jgi:hypothetical protein
MVYRRVNAAPTSALPEAQRGEIVGRFCKACGEIYAPRRARHRGKPIYGKDHVASPCAHEGEVFVDGAEWWEPAAQILPPPAAAPRTP